MPKPTRQKTPKGSGAKADDHISDPRFANIQTDARFRLPSKKSTHVQIDKRFAHMLRDENFSSRAKVDRYGRKLPKDAGRKELERYYRIEDEDSEGADGEQGEDEDEKIQQELERVKTGDEDLSSSSDDSSSDGDDLDEAEEDEVFGLLDQNEGEGGIPKGEVSSRLAVVNLDWDNIRAADLMAVFSSFVPSSGRISNVSIYPSEFGKDRMHREEMEGPPKEIFGQSGSRALQDDQSSSSEDGGQEEEDKGDEAEDERIKNSILKEDQGLEFDSAKLRRYQLERLRYYYAVLTCSSVSVAEAIYNAVDGTEYLTTANFFDLRYIPDETEFLDEKPRDECARIPDGYRPNEFVTDALQHSKVRLTWDADDGTRKEAQKRAFAGSRTDIDENDLKAYLGSDSSEDEAPEPFVVDATSASAVNGDHIDSKTPKGPKLSKKDAERQKMRALLGLQSEPVSLKKSNVEKNAPVGDMQITFSSGLSSEPNKGSVFENEPERDETTAEKYVRKEKERKARRKEKSKHKTDSNDATADQVEEVQPSGDQPDAEDPATQDLGFSDPFFTAPSHDKATTTAQRKAEKRQKREQRAADEAASAAKRAELELLMIDEKTGAQNINHFDMNESARAEKASKKKKSKKRLSEREKEALAVKEKSAFEMDVGDERFKDVFQRSDFAIDPSHPRFKGTEGMKQLLEEGRKKRSSGVVEDEEDGRRGKKARRKEVDEGEMDDVQRLVNRVKTKTKGQ
ncbi:hypothetical protein HO133_007431 [Letharia lupina]|uniref:NUC153 domain-containing protein n=1 Tax=Letharia lupina TaxID=560253 RepID=A0A8H6FIS4_9LECA|nr:uncharacterized protein HO133_007431 [Letharia lupina]KAF6229315.1 hypothetical protein HO133_007431 [Letharia lupina]